MNTNIMYELKKVVQMNDIGKKNYGYRVTRLVGRVHFQENFHR